MMTRTERMVMFTICLCLAVTIACGIYCVIVRAKQWAAAAAPIPAPVVTPRHDDHESDDAAFCRQLQIQLTTSLTRATPVIEIYPVKRGTCWRGMDKNNAEYIRIEVQRSQDNAIHGKTRYRTYTWTLTDVHEEDR